MNPIPKDQLLSKLLDGVKGCQSRFGSRTELATEDEETVRKLCIAFEDVFLHGAKLPEKGRSLWQMTENFVQTGLRLPTEHPSYWPLIKSQLSKHDAERFLLLHNVRTDHGRARAWLRSSLNEHSLERYILIILSLDTLPSYYETWAFLRDPELSTILPHTAAGLGSVLFALVVDNPLLDCWVRPTISKEDAVASPVEVAEVADQFLAALKKDQAAAADCSTTPNQRRPNLSLGKKKKKPHVNVVSFDDDGNNDAATKKSTTSTTPSKTHDDRNSTSPPQHHSSSTSTATTPTPTPTTPTPHKLVNSATSPVQIIASRTPSSASTSCGLQSHQNYLEDSSLPEISVYSSSVKSADCISVNSIYSDCSERVDLENVMTMGVGGDLSFGNISPSQRLKPVRDRAGTSGRDDGGSSSGGGGGTGGTGTDSDPNNDSSSQDLNLIPVPNFDPETSRRVAPELQIDLDMSAAAADLSPSPGATTPSYASEPVSSSRTHRHHSGKDMNMTASEIDARISTASGADEERIIKLKAILDREIETVATLQAQLADEKRKSTDTVKILEARVESLGNENEILKHQLNKYIGAVQLLKKERTGQGGRALGRRGSSFEEDDEHILGGGGGGHIINESPAAADNEGAEYERKLIQVAEMHGELMEFNAHLQTSLRKRDLVIRRLREELVDLRGPLSAPLLGGPGDDTGFDDGSWDIVDSASANSTEESLGGNSGLLGIGSPLSSAGGQRRQIHLTHNERVLINIWIPSAFLTGANTDLHHVYQVFIRIKDTEWNVYRRYSQFYSLHRDLKKRDSTIGSFYFPPKKHLGNKDGKFVDERRRKLQEYLRKVINHTLQSNSILAAHPDKNLLISIFPFFGESTFIHQKKKERSRASRMFFRPSSSSTSSASQQVYNSPSGFQTQLQYPQYTGL